MTWARERPFACYYAAVLVATLGWVLVFHIEIGGASADYARAMADKQHVLSDGVFSVFDKRGRALYDIEVDRMHYTPNDERFGFETADVRYATDGGDVLIRSQTGYFRLRDEVLVFDDKVRVRRMQDGRLQEEMRTSALTILAAEKVARSDEFAEIERGDSVITGTGVEINLESGKLKLLSNVRLKS